MDGLDDLNVVALVVKVVHDRVALNCDVPKFVCDKVWVMSDEGMTGHPCVCGLIDVARTSMDDGLSIGYDHVGDTRKTKNEGSSDIWSDLTSCGPKVTC